VVGFIVTDSTPPPGYSTGLIERDYSLFPVGYNAKPFDLPLIPESEYESRLKLQTDMKASLHHIRRSGMPDGSAIPSRDQGQVGYCWNHSVAAAMILLNAVQGNPYVDLSPFSVGCKIMNFQNRGGNGNVALEYVAKHGMCDATHWPQRSMSRSNDTEAAWADAAKNKVTEWMDLEPRNKAQLITCLLLNTPVVYDCNKWGHSICAMRIVSFRPFVIRIWNSWSDTWKDLGEGDINWDDGWTGDGMIAPRVSMGG